MRSLHTCGLHLRTHCPGCKQAQPAIQPGSPRRKNPKVLGGRSDTPESRTAVRTLHGPHRHRSLLESWLGHGRAAGGPLPPKPPAPQPPREGRAAHDSLAALTLGQLHVILHPETEAGGRRGRRAEGRAQPWQSPTGSRGAYVGQRGPQDRARRGSGTPTLLCPGHQGLSGLF